MYKARAALIAFASLIPHIVIAQDAQLKIDLAKCAVVDGDLSRLQCYDDLTQKMGLDGPQTIPSRVGDTGDWSVNRKLNPLDDSETVVLSLAAESGTNSWGKPVHLIVRCMSNTTEGYIFWGEYLASDDTNYRGEWKNVVVRIGDEKADTQRWSTSTDQKATFFPTSVIPMLRKMSKADSFVAQTTPYNESPVTAVFKLSGMQEALKPVMEVCGWTLD